MRKMGKNREMTIQKNGITEGVIWQQILLFFFPILFGTFFQQLYNTADAIIVGRFVGKEALSAVGGLFGWTVGILLLVIHLSSLTSMGRPYLSPFARGRKLLLLRKVKRQENMP